jgi:hypothetical protein
MNGTHFSDNVKLQARRLAFFRCCYCHERPGDDVHHLVPKEEGGLGELDNAILLCVQCHADYGHRPEKRAQLRQARDHWYEIVARRYAPVALHQVEEFNALRSDVSQMSKQLRFLTETVIGRFEAGSTGASDVVNIASTMISSIVAPPTASVRFQGLVPDIKVEKKSTE